jgi:PadR family transcriptional regulator, regulatory protein PadR
MWKKSAGALDAIPDFDQLVMLAVLRLSPDAYGIAIRREIEARTGRLVPLSTIYATLTRLEARGYVRSQLGSPTPERGGRRKRLYAMEPSGVAALGQQYRRFRMMVRGLEGILERA